MNKYKTKWKENALSLERQSNHFNRRVSRRTIRMYKCMNPRVMMRDGSQSSSRHFYLHFFYKGTNAGAGKEEKTMASIILVMSVQFCYFFFPYSFSAFFFLRRLLLQDPWWKWMEFFHAHPLKSVETFTSQRERAKGRTCWGTTRPLMESIQGVFHPIRR